MFAEQMLQGQTELAGPPLPAPRRVIAVPVGSVSPQKVVDDRMTRCASRAGWAPSPFSRLSHYPEWLWQPESWWHLGPTCHTVTLTCNEPFSPLEKEVGGWLED